MKFRELMATAIVVMFGFGVYTNPTDTGYAETLKNIMLVAVGFYLGGSKIGSDTASKNADIVGNQAATTPQAVTVVNTANDLVPVEGAK